MNIIVGDLCVSLILFIYPKIIGTTNWCIFNYQLMLRVLLVLSCLYDVCCCITRRRASTYIYCYLNESYIFIFVCVCVCAGTLMSTLTTMKFNGSRTMHENIIEMTNMKERLKTLGMNVNENFLVQFILISLPSEYDLFQMSYNTMEDKWNVHELHNMLVQEEMGLKNQGSHSVHYVSHQGNQGAENKFIKKHNKGKVMQSYPARALARRLHVDWARDPRKGPRVLMSLRVDFEPMG